MTTDKTPATLAEPRSHRWNDVGERCLDCGDKDWMGGPCSGPRLEATGTPWVTITTAPNDGRPHIRGLWVTSRIEGKPDTREWRQFIGLINDDGDFVDPDYGETFGWDADQYDAWMPLADAPSATLATAKHGGCGQLGGQVEPSFNWKEGVHDEASLRLAGKAWDNLMYEDSAGEYTPAQHDQIGRMLVNVEQMMEGHPFTINEEGQYVAKEAALSAQPSPGGQGVELDLDRVLSLADVHAEESREDGVRLLDRGGLLAFAQDAVSALAARQAVGEPVCTDCGTPLLFECTGCSRSNYPPYMQGAIGEIVYSGEGGLQIEFYDGKPLAPMKLYAAPPAQAVDLRPHAMDTAPRDGTMVRLLVLFEEHATEDTAEPAWTIGACNDDNVGEDERIGWHFAGWCWTHDHFTEGKGAPVGWLPLIDSQAVGK